MRLAEEKEESVGHTPRSLCSVAERRERRNELCSGCSEGETLLAEVGLALNII